MDWEFFLGLVLLIVYRFRFVFFFFGCGLAREVTFSFLSLFFVEFVLWF